MKFVSWNVNGLRAIRTKGFDDIVRQMDADFFCVQETKLQEGQIDLDELGYHSYWHYAEKKGYSGVAILARTEPLSVRQGIGSADHDSEGRALTLEYPDFYLVNIYAPNAQAELRRIDFRCDWEDRFRAYLQELDKSKPLVICGDFNVARNDIDLKHPELYRGTTGFSDPERAKLEQLIGAGFVDTYRALHPDTEKVYTWWSYQMRSRQRNDGWRIDYFLISERLLPRLTSAEIY
ncbi:MAG: exodeoxyribonuclease III, partial [Bacteroidales bacterium]|nr:exodeoxyribonuclease III [Bacteroidales bacterium]